MDSWIVFLIVAIAWGVCLRLVYQQGWQAGYRRGVRTTEDIRARYIATGEDLEGGRISLADFDKLTRE